MANEKQFLTITEAADYLKVSKTSLRRWTNDGRLSCYRVGHRNERRFALEDLSAFLKKPHQPLSEPYAAHSFPANCPPINATSNASNTPTRKHICTYYKSTTHQWQLLRGHLLNHLTSEARTVYLYHRSKGHIDQWLADEGLDPNQLIQNRILERASTSDSYLIDGYFDLDRMLAFWQRIIDEHRRLGTKYLLLTGEMGWATSGLKGCDQLIPYEAALDEMLRSYPWVSVICQYPVFQFSGVTVYDNICVHTHLQTENILVPCHQ